MGKRVNQLRVQVNGQKQWRHLDCVQRDRAGKFQSFPVLHEGEEVHHTLSGTIIITNPKGK